MTKKKTESKSNQKKLKAKSDPYRESQPLSAADVRDIVKDELANFRASIVEEVVEKLKDAGTSETAAEKAQANQDPYSLEAPMPSVEREAYAPVMHAYELRRQVGMSRDMAELNAKIAQGMDLTPLQFNLPSPESYFTSIEGFKDFYVSLVAGGDTQRDAYTATCAKFEVANLEKNDPRQKVLAELPMAAGGAFALSAPDAARQLGLPLLDAPKEE